MTDVLTGLGSQPRGTDDQAVTVVVELTENEPVYSRGVPPSSA
jgi:hypothetical protein